MDDLILDSNSLSVFKRICALQRQYSLSSSEEQISSAVEQITLNDSFM